jgi:fatty-acyl-CoA synthase
MNDFCNIRKFSDILEMEKKDITSRFPRRNIPEILSELAVNKSNDVAIQYIRTGMIQETVLEVTFQNLYQKIIQMSNFLNDLNVKEEDTISLILPNILQSYTILWAVQTCAIACPMDIYLSIDQIAQILLKTKSKFLIAMGPSQYGIWKKALNAIKILKQKSKNETLEIPKLIYVGAYSEFIDNALCFNLEIQNYNDKSIDFTLERNLENICTLYISELNKPEMDIINYSSLDLLSSSWQNAQAMGISEKSIVLNTYQISSLVGSGMLSLAPILMGGCCVIGTPFGLKTQKMGDNFWKLIEKHNISHIIGSRFDFINILSSPFADSNLDSLKRAYVVGYPAPKSLKSSFLSKIKIDLQNAYGFNDTKGLVFMEFIANYNSSTTVGWKMPYKYVKVQDGEYETLEVRFPIIFSNPILTPKDNKSELKWINSLDYGFKKVNFEYHILGNHEDFILINNQRIYCWEIEQKLYEIPEIKSCAVMNYLHLYKKKDIITKEKMDKIFLFINFWPGEFIEEPPILKKLKNFVSKYPNLSLSIIKCDIMPVNQRGDINKRNLSKLLK